MTERELIERVLTEHWDFVACRCAFCLAANELGCRPRDGYPTDPRPKITEEKWVENKQVLYDWEAKR